MIMETNLCVTRSCGMTNVRSAAGRECSHNNNIDDVCVEVC